MVLSAEASTSRASTTTKRSWAARISGARMRMRVCRGARVPPFRSRRPSPAPPRRRHLSGLAFSPALPWYSPAPPSMLARGIANPTFGARPYRRHLLGPVPGARVRPRHRHLPGRAFGVLRSLPSLIPISVASPPAPPFRRYPFQPCHPRNPRLRHLRPRPSQHRCLSAPRLRRGTCADLCKNDLRFS